MRWTISALACLCLILSTSTAPAKEKKHEKQMDQQAMMEFWKKMAMPGEPHKLFSSLAGSWTTTSREWMEPGKPPTESTGTAEMKMLLDGRFLYQEYNAQMMGQPFSGVGIDAYDNMTKKYVTAWMDSMGTGIFVMEGTASADGKTITLKGSHPEADPSCGLEDRRQQHADVRHVRSSQRRQGNEDVGNRLYPETVTGPVPNG
jgi:Protein of unknown function (DUF1579)